MKNKILIPAAIAAVVLLLAGSVFFAFADSPGVIFESEDQTAPQSTEQPVPSNTPYQEHAPSTAIETILSAAGLILACIAAAALVIALIVFAVRSASKKKN